MSEYAKQAVSAQRWYHSTHWTQWEKLFATRHFVVHLGTLDAALQRAADTTNLTAGTHYRKVYEVQIVGDPNLAEAWDADDRQHTLQFTPGFDGWLYANRNEDRGSTSLALRGDFLRVVASGFVKLSIRRPPRATSGFDAQVKTEFFEVSAEQEQLLPASLKSLA